jgi:MFS family permease
MHQLGDPTDARLAWPSPQRAWWTVAVLTFTYIVSFVDRTILGLLIEPIKADLSLNDTEIGLVVGLAFGVFYAVMGLPLGWLADRTSRRGLIAVGAALWCAATARPPSPRPRCRSSAIRSRRSGAQFRSVCTQPPPRWVPVLQ